MEIKLWELILKYINVELYNFNIYNSINKQIKNTNFNNNYFKLIYSKNKFDIKHIDNYYISKQIVNYINNKINTLNFYKLENDSELYLYYNDFKFNKNDINFIINKLVKCYTIIIRYFSKNDKRKFYIYLTPFRKQIDEKSFINNKLYKNNINSGFCFTYNGDIVLYRLEELEKVFFHELIHSYEIDYSITNLELNLNINKFLKINEVLTEILAEIIYYNYLNLEYKINLKKIVELEYKFSIYSCIKYLKFFSYEKIQDLLYKNNKKIYDDDSNSIEYTIIKTSILTNINDFINKFFENGKFKDINNNDFQEFIKKTLFSKKFILDINNNFNKVSFINTNKMVLIDNLYK